MRSPTAVAEAVVVAREDRPGDRYLAAYLRRAGAVPAVPELRAFLKERLPDYMVPSAIVGLEALVAKAVENRERLVLRSDVLATECARAQEERRALEQRESEARAAVVRQEDGRREADGRLSVAQRQLLDAREAAEVISRRAADARAAHAGLVERATALAAEVTRQQEAIDELESRFAARQEEARQSERRQVELRQAIEAGYSNFGWMQNDPDLVPLKNDPEFLAMMQPR